MIADAPASFTEDQRTEAFPAAVHDHACSPIEDEGDDVRFDYELRDPLSVPGAALGAVMLILFAVGVVALLLWHV